MPTLAELKDRIARELHRTDMAADIHDALQDAVDLHRARRFRFNEARATFNTTANVEFYGTAQGLPADVLEIDSLRVTVNGRDVMLTAWTPRTIDEVATTVNTTGQPVRWAWDSGRIRFYPVPDRAYPIHIAYLRSLPLPADSASNAWTTDAAALLRHTAKRLLCMERLQDFENATAHQALETQELNRLLRERKQLDTGPLMAGW